MDHLNIETLARLVDETPSAEEARHLGGCSRCGGTLEELRQQRDALARLPDLRPPPGDWEILQARLVSEGLMEGRSRLRGLAHTPGWMKAAAAVILFIAGTGLGAALSPSSSLTTARGTAGDAGPFVQASTEFATVEEAREGVRRAERAYMDAWVQYRQLVEEAGDEALPDPASRIAALEYMVRAGRTALREAPADPFLNGLVASAAAEREATIRQASTSSGEVWH